MSKRPGANKDNLEETRKIFLKIAREEFAKEGYANASTSRIVEKSGMARGSLYYHFGDKQGLFFAVYEQMMEYALENVNKSINQQKDPWNGFLEGCLTFFDLCMKEDFRKIVLIESQAAISFKERLMVQERTLLGKLRELIEILTTKGYFVGHNKKASTIFILGILTEVGRSFDFSDNLQEDRTSFGAAFKKSMAQMAGA